MTKSVFSKTFRALAAALALTLAGGTVTEVQAAYNMRVYSSLAGDESSSHYVWFKHFEDSLKDDNYEKRKGFFKNLRDRFSS